MKKIINSISIAVIGGIITLSAIFFFLNFQNSNKDKSLNLENKNDSSENIISEDKFKIIAAGDSLTAGYGLSLDDSYPKLLEAKLIEQEKAVEVINAGISGETSAGLLDRTDFITTQSADMILITIGGNDAFRNLPIKNTKENIQNTIKILKQKVDSRNIYLLEIQAPANLGLSYRNEFNKMYKEIAKSENINTLPFVVPEVFLDKSKMLDDGIHPNKSGYEYIVDKFLLQPISIKVI